MPASSSSISCGLRSSRHCTLLTTAYSPRNVHTVSSNRPLFKFAQDCQKNVQAPSKPSKTSSSEPHQKSGTLSETVNCVHGVPVADDVDRAKSTNTIGSGGRSNGATSARRRIFQSRDNVATKDVSVTTHETEIRLPASITSVEDRPASLSTQYVDNDQIGNDERMVTEESPIIPAELSRIYLADAPGEIDALPTEPSTVAEYPAEESRTDHLELEEIASSDLEDEILDVVDDNFGFSHGAPVAYTTDSSSPLHTTAAYLAKIAAIYVPFAGHKARISRPGGNNYSSEDGAPASAPSMTSTDSVSDHINAMPVSPIGPEDSAIEFAESVINTEGLEGSLDIEDDVIVPGQLNDIVRKPSETVSGADGSARKRCICSTSPSDASADDTTIQDTTAHTDAIIKPPRRFFRFQQSIPDHNKDVLEFDFDVRQAQKSKISQLTPELIQALHDPFVIARERTRLYDKYIPEGIPADVNVWPGTAKHPHNRLSDMLLNYPKQMPTTFLYDPTTPPLEADHQLRLMLRHSRENWDLAHKGALRPFPDPATGIACEAYLSQRISHRIEVFKHASDLTLHALQDTYNLIVRRIHWLNEFSCTKAKRCNNSRALPSSY